MTSHGVGRPDDIEGAFLTAANTDDATLEAPTWYNLATFYERQNRPEKARTALARAVLKRKDAVALEKLAGRSPCLAEIPTTANVESPRPSVVTGWRGVCEAVGACQKHDTQIEDVTEAKARERVCALVANRDSAQAASCDDAGPWSFQYKTSPQEYQLVNAWVYPLPHGKKPQRFFVGEWVQASHSEACMGNRTESWQMRAGYAWFESDEEPLWGVHGRATPQVDPANGACGQSAKQSVTGVFELNTAKPLAVIAQIERYPVTIALDVASKRLTLTGSRCDGYLALDGAMRWTAH
jgi:hypothetical protein